MDDLALGETYRSNLANFSETIHMSEGLNLFEEGILQMAVNLIPFFQHLFIKLGKHGGYFKFEHDGHCIKFDD